MMYNCLHIICGIFSILSTFFVFSLMIPSLYCHQNNQVRINNQKKTLDDTIHQLNSSCKEISMENLAFIKDGDCIILKTSLEVNKKCDFYLSDVCHACIQSGMIIEQLQWNRSGTDFHESNTDFQDGSYSHHHANKFTFSQIWSEKTIKWPAEYRQIYDNFRNKAFSWKSRMQTGEFNEVSLAKGRMFLDSKIRGYIAETGASFIDYREYLYPTVMQQVATIIFEKRPKMTIMGKKWPFLGEKWPFGPLFRGKLHPDHA